MAATAVSPVRQIKISVIDSAGRPVVGADIHFAIDGMPAGGVRHSAGRASIGIAKRHDVVEVRAAVAGVTRSHCARPKGRFARVSFCRSADPQIVRGTGGAVS